MIFINGLCKLTNKPCIKNLVNRRTCSTGQQVLPFTDIPLVKGYPIIGSLVELLSNMDKLHELLNKRLKEYGPIYREKIGIGSNSEQVFTANVEDWENVLRGEARGTPADKLELWSAGAYAKKKDGIKESFFNMKGAEYARMKEGVKPLLMPKNIAALVPQLADVTDDLMDLLASKTDSDCVVKDIQDAIHKWSYECGGVMTFRIRFGMLNPDESAIDAKILKSFRSCRLFFELLYQLETGLPHHRTQLTSTWKLYERTLDEFNESIAHFFNKYGEHVTDKKVELTDTERIDLAKSVVVASADTTAHTAVWTLIELANNPQVQEKIYNEMSGIPMDRQFTSSDLQSPYLRGILKEVFRVRPIIPMSPKILTEDLILSGYEVPSGTTVNLMLGAYDQDKWFSDSTKMNPERWYRGKEVKETPNPFTVLPFGHGQRSCLGRRLAENEMYIFIAKVIRRFKISAVADDYDSNFQIFVVPEGPINFKLVER